MGNSSSSRLESNAATSSIPKSADSVDTENLTEGSSTVGPVPVSNRKEKDIMGKNKQSPMSPTATLPTTPKVDRRDDVPPRSSIIRDDQIQVNLAMADLMAYLQVVANNSNNLPLTPRDDPELHRMVSNLSSEEYARKSAAFIPADVRVIGGSFLKYGKVWDLPTSEEYTALDGAQEPGTYTQSNYLKDYVHDQYCD
jgi:hypothetical protein